MRSILAQVNRLYPQLDLIRFDLISRGTAEIKAEIKPLDHRRHGLKVTGTRLCRPTGHLSPGSLAQNHLLYQMSKFQQ